MAIAKPIVVIWAGLNAIDDLSLLFRFARLGSVLVPGLSSLQPHMMCDVCDDVMGDLLKGTDGLEALPCNWACLFVENRAEVKGGTRLGLGKRICLGPVFSSSRVKSISNCLAELAG